MKLQHLALAAVAVPTLLASCIDNTWDLSDIDLTIGTNADITLPTSSTGEIILRNVLDLEDDGVVKMVKDGVILTKAEYDALTDQEKDNVTYVVSQTGSADIDPVKIDPITISRPDVSDFEARIQRGEFGMSQARKATARKTRGSKAPLDISIDLTRIYPQLGDNYRNFHVSIPTEEYGYTILPEDNTNYDISNAKAENVSDDIISLDNVTLQGATAYVNLGEGRIDFENASEIKYIHLDDFTVSYPKGLHLLSAEFDYDGIQHNLAKDIDNVNSKVILTHAKSEPIDTKLPILLILNFDKAIMGQDITFDGNEKSVEIGGQFRIDGSFRIVTDEMDARIVEQKIAQAPKSVLEKMIDITNPTDPKVNLDLVALGLIPNEVTVTGDASFKGDIDIATVSGVFTHEVGDIDPIKLDDMPDFLNDDDVVLDLDNPLVFVSISNSLPATINIGETTSSKGLILSAEGKEYYTGQLTVQQHDNYYMLADRNSSIRPSNYLDKNVEWREVKNLPELLTDVPDQIDLNVEPVYLTATDLVINKEYPLTVDYEVYAPLEFGDDFLLVYSDSERDLADDLEDAEDIDLGHIELQALIDSNLPAAITFTLIPIDKSGQKIEALKDIAIDVPANVENHPIHLTIETTSQYTINDVINGRNGAQKLDGVTYRAEMKKGTEDNTTLRPENTVRLHDIKLTIKGGITYDAN